MAGFQACAPRLPLLACQWRTHPRAFAFAGAVGRGCGFRAISASRSPCRILGWLPRSRQPGICVGQIKDEVRIVEILIVA